MLDKTPSAGKTAARSPWNSNALLEDFEHLTQPEMIAYTMLAFCAWLFGPLPLDRASLQAKTRLSDQQFVHARVPLLAFFDRTPGGWSHRRIESERAAWIASRMHDNKGGR